MADETIYGAGFNPLQALNDALSNSNGDALTNIQPTDTVNPTTAQGSEGSGSSENLQNVSQGTPSSTDGLMTVPTPTMIGGTSADYTDGVQESLDKIFGAIIAGGLDPKNATDNLILREKADVFKQTLHRFLNGFRTNIFKDEYAVLYSALQTLSIKVFSLNQLWAIMDYSADDILGSNAINLDKYAYNSNNGATTDDEKLEAFKYDVADKFNYLSRLRVTVDEFDTACQVYKMHFRENYMADLTQSMAVIMSDGLTEKVGRGRNRTWKGSEDCKEYYNLKIAILEGIEGADGTNDDNIIAEDWFSEEMDRERVGDEPILLTTGIDEIDSVYGGLVRGNMFEVMGPPKGGKTTFIQYLVDRALEGKLNVAVWALEGTREEWIAAIVSLMVKKQSGIVISKRNILKRIYHSEKERQAVIAAKNELAMSIERGRVSFIGKACVIEDMKSILENHWKNVNPFDVIVVDSPILAVSRTGKSKTDTAAEAYTQLKHYISYEMNIPAVALVTCQMKQAVIDQIRNNPEAEVDVTAGGVTAETIRTPDFVTCLVSTKEERKMGQVKMHDVASRHSESFDTFYMGAELGCCYFYSDPALNEV